MSPLVAARAAAAARGYGWGSLLAEPSDFEHIETITVSAGGAASVTFSSIPQTYKHLQLRAVTRSSARAGLLVRPSADSVYTNYAAHYLDGNGASAYSGSITNNTTITGFYVGYTEGATYPHSFVFDILDYQSTSKNKVGRSLQGADTNGGGGIGLYSSLWMSTSAVTSLMVMLQGSNTFSQYSTFSLYGIKG